MSSNVILRKWLGIIFSHIESISVILTAPDKLMGGGITMSLEVRCAKRAEDSAFVKMSAT